LHQNANPAVPKARELLQLSFIDHIESLFICIILTRKSVSPNRILRGAFVEYSDILNGGEKRKGTGTERSVGEIGRAAIIDKVCSDHSHGGSRLVDV